MSPIEIAPSIEELLRRAAHVFRDRFGASPRWAAAAPGRVNLIGEHTDYNQGLVLPIAIDRACVCVGAPAADASRSRLFSVDQDEVSVDLRSPVEPGGPVGWAKYVVGVCEEFFAATGGGGGESGGGRGNLDMVVASSVPLGAGLSSSAALEVAAATLLEQATGVAVTPIEKARLCRSAEHRYANVPCGIMDQYAAIFGKPDHALLIDCRDETHENVPMPPGDETGAAVVIVNSNVRHELAAGQYASRRAACEGAARAMAMRSLREIDPYESPELIELLTPEQQGCAIHVFNENIRVRNVVGMLREGGEKRQTWKRMLPQIGGQINSSHASLRDTYKVSCPELDTLVEIACSVHGVYGARMTGGGFGGCIIALTRPPAVEKLVRVLHDEYPERHGRDCTVYVTHAAGPAALSP